MDDNMTQNQSRRVVRGIKRTIQWQPGLRPSWTIEQARAAMLSHQHGNFEASALLVEAMMGDDELPTALKKAVSLIVGSKFTMAPEVTPGTEEADASSKEQAEMLEPLWPFIAGQRAMHQLIRWYIMMGVAVGELVWDTSGPVWIPKLNVLHPQFLWYDHAVINPATGDRGAFKYNSESGNVEVVNPGDGRWVLLGDHDSMINEPGVRALCAAWLSKQYALRDWNRYNERHGLPILKAFVPYQAADEDKNDFFNSVSNMGSETVAMLPTGLDAHGTKFDIELEEATDGSWESFKALIERCDRKVQMYFQGTNTNELLDASGSRNTTQSGRDIAKENAAAREAEISEWLREQIVKPFVKVNVADPNLYMLPKPHYKVLGDADNFKEAEAAKALFETVSAAKAAGYKVNNAERLAKDLGLDVEFDEEAAEMARQAHEAAIAPKESGTTPDSNRDTSREQPQERTNGQRVEEE